MPTEELLFCVCTHGKHDACCAEKGRPVAAALAAAYPEETWEVSHIGGDRFAGNALVLPYGLYLGRLDPESAVAAAADVLGGRLPLEVLRGRSCLPMAAQAAEIALFRHLGETAMAAVRVLRVRRDAELTAVDLGDRRGALDGQPSAPPSATTSSSPARPCAPTPTRGMRSSRSVSTESRVQPRTAARPCPLVTEVDPQGEVVA